MYEKHHLLVAVDGSETSDEAVEVAGDLAATYDAITHVIHVSPDLRGVVIPGGSQEQNPCHAHDSVTQSELSYGERALAKAEARLKELGVKDIRLLNEMGNPADKIAHAAERNNCTAVVIGSRGLGGITGTVLGSISRAVVDKASCITIVVKPGSSKIGPQRQPEGR